MNAKALIKKLEKLVEEHGDLEIVMDYDEIGWYAIEEAERVFHVDEEDKKDSGTYFINIQSSNEA